MGKAVGHNFHDFVKLIPACLGIIVTMVVVPQMYLTNVLLPLAALAIYAIVLFFFRQKGAPFILIAMALCIPCVSDEGNSFITAPINGIFFLIFRLVIVLFYFVYFIRYRRTGAIKGIFVSIMALALFYTVYLTDFFELSKWINTFIYIPLFFIVCRLDKASFRDISVFFDLFFIITLIYAVLDFFFNICPYTEIYDLSKNIEYFELSSFRARGVLSNPLMLSMVFLFYQAMLYIRMILFKQNVSFLLILSLFGCMMSLSRTAIIGSVLLFVYYMVFVQKLKSRKLLISFIVVIGALIILTELLMNSFFFDLLSRFEEERFSDSHRYSAYLSTWALFKDNLLGVGSENVMTEIVKYAKHTLIIDLTLDNFFLTAIASYGLLSFIVFEFYFHPFFKAFYRWGYISRNQKIFHSFFLIFLCWCMIGFSFDLEAFATTQLFVYGMTGSLWGYAVRMSRRDQLINKTSTEHVGSNSGQL